MTAAVKYQFDRAFDVANEPARQPGSRLHLAAFEDDPVYGPADLAAAREAGHAEGRLAGLAEARAGIEAAAAAALDRLAASLEGLLGEREAQIMQVKEASARIAIATAKRLAAELLARDPAIEIEGLLAQALPELHQEPRVTVRLSPPALAALAPRLERIAAAAGFPGRIDLVPATGCADQDCTVEWSTGGVERDEARIAAEIDAVVARFFAPASSRQD